MTPMMYALKAMLIEQGYSEPEQRIPLLSLFTTLESGTYITRAPKVIFYSLFKLIQFESDLFVHSL